MANITAAVVKELREITAAGMLDCKNALVENDGNMDAAIDYLRKKGLSKAAKKSDRIAAEGLVSSYIHGGRIGVLIEVNSETDFVAKNEEFQAFVKDLAMQVAAQNPKYIRPEDVPAEVLEKEKEILKAQALNEGKPEKIVDKMVEGRIKKYYDENCLICQSFIKNPDITIQDLLNEKIAKIGENLIIRRFTRYEVGEGIEKKVENFAEEVAKQINM
ncbi:MAG: elongation factor Ts [Firmicutes bacterium HGW-Firmicutes-18]|nr:MAG: elongation factor Ts [Firmicutes bacterium HGW-Firmicutes-18]